MSDQTPSEITNLDRYGFAELPWERAHDALSVDPTADNPSFLGTVRPDGKPHAAGIGAQWMDGDIYFTSSPDARKARNLALNAACTISVRLPTIDLVLDGSAERTTDPETLERIAAGYREGGWPCEVEGDAFTAPFSAPSAGPPPWHVYRFVFHTVVGVATADPSGATRWRFDRPTNG